MEAKPNFKTMSLSQKAGYVWDYYRFHILGIIISVIIAGSIIHHYATLKESVLDMLFLNAHTIDNEQLPFEDFMAKQGYNTNDYEITVTTTLSFALEEGSYQQDYYSIQTLSALFAAGDLDIFAAPHQIYNDYASSGYVADLRNIFTKEELEEFGDIIIYTTLLETGESFPSGFNLEGNQWLIRNGYYDEGCYLAIAANTDNPELTKEFIYYLLSN